MTREGEKRILECLQELSKRPALNGKRHDGVNVNSFIISFASALLLGAIAWVGNKTSGNNDEIMKLTTTIPEVSRQIEQLKSDTHESIQKLTSASERQTLQQNSLSTQIQHVQDEQTFIKDRIKEISVPVTRPTPR
jgi:hypothetical protein